MGIYGIPEGLASPQGTDRSLLGLDPSLAIGPTQSSHQLLRQRAMAIPIQFDVPLQIVLKDGETFWIVSCHLVNDAAKDVGQ
jgi:hypothetical protein